MYAIDRRTVTHICTANSPHYKNVKQEEIGLGRDRFEEKYLRPELVEKAIAFTAANKESEPINNKHAKTKAGIHKMRSPMCDYDHRVVIQWREPDSDIQIAGWYYQDLDGDSPDRWLCSPRGESLKTSQACYNNALEEIYDKEMLDPVIQPKG